MIAIKEIEMPKNCLDCPISHEDEVVDYICTKTGKNVYLYANEVHPNCPLVEIVTCEDCKHCYPDEDGRGYHCERDSNVRFSVHRDFWCADGKRKEK